MLQIYFFFFFQFEESTEDFKILILFSAVIFILRYRRQRGKNFNVVADIRELSRFFGHNLAKSETAVNLFRDVADSAKPC
jgi:hypothetical protein